MLYGAATQFLGYRVYEDEWKVMGLAALGRPRFANEVRRLIRFRDGAFRLALEFFSFQYADKGMWYGPRFQELFGPPRRPDEPVQSERFADLAASFQLVAEEIGLALVRHLLTLGGGCRKLCLAGGVALNAVLNGKILAETDVEELFVQPAASDSGAALGAALHLHHTLPGARRAPALRDVYLGPGYEDDAIAGVLAAENLPCERVADPAGHAAALLAEGKVIGWFQGRMEYGPRALGNRSILADPRRADMKAVVNAKVKFREAFRPFAPAVLAERADEFFEGDRGPPVSVYDRRVARPAGKARGHPGRDAFRRHGPAANGRAGNQPAFPRAGRGVRPIDRRARGAQHFVQSRGRADRLHAGRCDLDVPAQRPRRPGGGRLHLRKARAVNLHRFSGGLRFLPVVATALRRRVCVRTRRRSAVATTGSAIALPQPT